jgi:hypothetical protein
MVTVLAFMKFHILKDNIFFCPSFAAQENLMQMHTAQNKYQISLPAKLMQILREQGNRRVT